jgi:exodeoxyribonuclease X
MEAIVLDTETTGMEPEKGDQLVELAGVRLSDGQSYEKLCDPGRDIPPEAKAVHHITEDMVRGWDAPEHAAGSMLEVLGLPDYMVAHNAPFDKGFMQLLGEVYRNTPWICTWRCAMHLWPEAPSHSNQVLRYWLGLSPDLPADLYPHRALYDTIVTRHILLRMLETHSLDDLHRLSYQPVVLLKVRFGKHRGLLWSQVPRDYLQWVIKQQDMDDDVRHTAMHHLRGGQGSLL